MCKYPTPKMVQAHFDEMINTMETLEKLGFATLMIPPILSTDEKKESTICWRNEKKSEGVNAKNFSDVTSYQKVLINRTFQLLLFDNSIVRCALKFKDDVLVSQNFSWLPCPLSFESYEISVELQPELISEEIQEEEYDKNRVLMRSTVRFDYDSTNDSPEHPSSHMHFQNPETRVNIEGPICFNTFMKHVIVNYYPESYYLKKKLVPKELYNSLGIDNWKGLAFKIATPKKRSTEYLSKEIFRIERLVMG